MLFVVAGRFRPGAEPERIAIHEEFSAHLSQRTPRVHFGGPLYDEAGQRSGVLLVVEAPDFTLAHAFLDASPYKQAGLYEWSFAAEIRPEVGALS